MDGALMERYVAFLRGINVGGKSIIKMAELKDCVASLGYSDVRTYIASGNVLFATRKRARAKLEAELEQAIEERFALPVRVAVRTAAEMAALVESVPKDWIGDATRRVSVAFLLPGLDARSVAKELTPKEGIDEVVAAPGAVLIATRRDALTRTGLRLVGTPLYKELTVRNLNTTLKLAELLAQ